MGFVMVNDSDGLAFVLPTATGGTELVYLTGEPKNRLGLRRDDAAQLLDVRFGASTGDGVVGHGLSDADGGPK